MIRPGRSFWWFLGLIMVSFLLSRLPGLSQNPIYSRLTLILALVVGVNLLLASVSVWGVTLHRTTRTNRKQVGEIFGEHFEIQNKHFLPKVWLKVTDLAALPGRAGSRVLTGIGAHQIRSYVAYTLLRQRGWFHLGPTRVESGDLLGMVTVSKTFDAIDRLLVLPQTVPLTHFPAPFGNLPGGRALRQKTLEVTPYAAGVREYAPGDPLKRIHWPTSARKQTLIVKEFEKDPLAEVWIFLDARADVHVRQTPPGENDLSGLWWVRERQPFQLPGDTEEYAITLAASIGQFYIRQKREVGLVTAGQRYTILPAERGERQLGKMLETLAVLRAEGALPLWGLISAQWGHLARGSTVILITPAAEDEMLSVVMALIQRGLMPVVILIDAGSFGGGRSPDDLQGRLNARGIVNFVIRAGDDLRAVLETPSPEVNDWAGYGRG